MHLDAALHPAEAVALRAPISLDSKGFAIRSSAVEPPGAARGSWLPIPRIDEDSMKSTSWIHDPLWHGTCNSNLAWSQPGRDSEGEHMGALTSRFQPE
jgi:hypothetical protein